MRAFYYGSLLLALLMFSTVHAQSGKISGVVEDAETGEGLIGVNVIVVGTTYGAAADIEGNYSILNVPPGTYSLRASMVGYSPVTVQNVRVNIDQTTNINFQLSPETLETEEVIVVATQPVVQKDVSSSRLNLNFEEIENLPVVSAERVVGLQAGIQTGADGPIIRGGNADETAFVVNGITFRDERDNTPFTAISFTSIKEIQVSTGGFNAEYGNIRSGLVNVVTKDGDRDKYTVTFLGRYRAADAKHFGAPANDLNSYWIRPYIDDAVAWTGTNSGAWDIFTQRQYQEFRGWNKVSEELLNDDNPENDLSPEAAQRLFLWQHRKPLSIVDPDYDIDLSVTGPVPFVSKALGGLRFMASYKSTQEMYLIPLSDDAYRDYSFQLKVTSDIATGMKLTLDGLLGQQTGTNSSRSGGPGLFRSPGSMANDMDSRSGASFLDARVFATDYWAPSTIERNAYGAKFTHAVNQNTYYEVYFNQFGSSYDTNPGDLRDTTRRYEIGGEFWDEAPYGAFSGFGSGIGSGMNMGLGFSNSRDTSKISTYTLKFDLASQLNPILNLKSGFEFIYTNSNVNYGLIEPSLPTNNSITSWQTFPYKGAFYAQSKLEFEGMVANLGVRLDYSTANTEWYLYDPYSQAFSGKLSDGIDTLLEKEPADFIFEVSPRLGVAFPITVNSKLYFNYGHFRNLPAPEQLFLLRRNIVSNRVDRIADPNNPLPKTVAYELGYEHNIYEQYLLRVAGYYKDVSEQPRLVRYINTDNTVDYFRPEPFSYEDIRGFEITLSKNRGEWIRGFVNYTYMVTTSGFFGFPTYFENNADQRELERNTRLFYQQRPVPRPYARFNVDFFTPQEFGPKLGGIYLLGDWRLNVLANWSSGVYFSWTGPGPAVAGFENNIQWNDFYNVDLRFSKSFNLGSLNLEFFVDIQNALNIQRLDYRAGFIDGADFDAYMTSLHLPDEYNEFGYGNIVGEDNPGDYRDFDVDFVPIVYSNNVGEINPNNINYNTIYYDAATGRYMENAGSEWTQVDSGRMDQILEDKAYIDNPNLPYLGFLNPRDIYWGLRFTLEIN